MAFEIFKREPVKRYRADKAAEVNELVAALKKAGPGYIVKSTMAAATVLRYTDELVVKPLTGGLDQWNSRAWLKETDRSTDE